MFVTFGYDRNITHYRIYVNILPKKKEKIMKLKDYIEMEDMTVAQFSRRVKVTPRSISRILNLEHDISLSLAIRIQRATRNKVKVEELISEQIILGEQAREREESCA